MKTFSTEWVVFGFLDTFVFVMSINKMIKKQDDVAEPAMFKRTGCVSLKIR